MTFYVAAVFNDKDNTLICANQSINTSVSKEFFANPAVLDGHFSYLQLFQFFLFLEALFHLWHGFENCPSLVPLIIYAQDVFITSERSIHSSRSSSVLSIRFVSDPVPESLLALTPLLLPATCAIRTDNVSISLEQTTEHSRSGHFPNAPLAEDPPRKSPNFFKAKLTSNWP